MDKAVSFIIQGIDNNKLILTETSFLADMSQASHVYSVYLLSYILHSVGVAREIDPGHRIISKLIDFLLAQMEEGGIWRFFGKNNPFPPPDFDDTCCILAALMENGINVETNVLDLLPKYQSKEGVFYTWIDEDMNLRSKFHIDGAVNANILYFTSMSGKKIESIIRFINTFASQRRFRQFSKWSVSDYLPIYIITRLYDDRKIVELDPGITYITKYLVQHQQSDGSWGNYLDTTLAFCALINAGYNGTCLLESFNYLIKAQNQLQTLRPYAAFRELSARYRYYGSSYLATAIFLEAMVKLHRNLKDQF